MNSLRLFVLRHGETAWSGEPRYAGTRDIPLTDLGRRQCAATARVLATEPLVAVYSSPLERARTSAEAIAKPHRLELTIEPGFSEMAFGAWEGLTPSEVASRYPETYATWQTTPGEAEATDGERVVDVAERVTAAVRRLRDAHPEGHVALVTHGIVSRLIVLDALGLGPERLWSLDAPPAGITEIEYRADGITVHRLNTCSHLRTLDA